MLQSSFYLELDRFCLHLSTPSRRIIEEGLLDTTRATARYLSSSSSGGRMKVAGRARTTRLSRGDCSDAAQSHRVSEMLTAVYFSR